MVDADAKELDITICGRNFAIKQSPGVLQSKRAGGTTGAAVWKVSVHFSEWLGSSTNPLFRDGILDTSSVVIELGSGISGLVPSMLSPRVGSVIATDQQYAVKLLQENIQANQTKSKPVKAGNKTSGLHPRTNNTEVLPLDWEEDDIKAFLRLRSLENGVDAVIVCDCVYNYAVIQPLVQTCVDICSARAGWEGTRGTTIEPTSTLCIITQQLRQPDVFESWLRSFMAAFHVWRLPDSMLTDALSETSGFVVHVGILRKASSSFLQ